MKRTFSSSTLLLVVTMLSLAMFLPALQSGVGGGGQSNVGGGGGGVPGGANTQIQFNNNGAFGGTPGFTVSGVNPIAVAIGQPGVSFATLTLNDSTGGAAIFTTNGSGPLLFNKTLSVGALATATNCSSSASPAVCTSAAAGSVVIAAAATTVQVNTSAVTANSQIFIQEDDSLGTKLSVTCNTTSLGATKISARTGGTSFTITTATAPTTNPACLSYWIVN